MKKKFALIFLTLTCILLCSCGGTGGSSSSFFKTKKEIEITMDNWQEYFEIKDDIKSVNNIEKNAFDEVEDIYLIFGTYFSLKEEYMDSFVSVDVAIEVMNNQAEVALVKYNLANETYELEYSDNDYSVNMGSFYPFYETVSNDSNRTIIEAMTDIECKLDKNRQEFESVEGDIANIYVILYPNCEVTRIQGTLVIKE